LITDGETRNAGYCRSLEKMPAMLRKSEPLRG
jgi:hypothetical protein